MIFDSEFWNVSLYKFEPLIGIERAYMHMLPNDFCFFMMYMDNELSQELCKSE